MRHFIKYISERMYAVNGVLFNQYMYESAIMKKSFNHPTKPVKYAYGAIKSLKHLTPNFHTDTM